MSDPSDHWDERYRDPGVEDALPATVLNENQHLLPDTGRALDLACGLGANALLLARLGLETEAWDISSVAVAKLRAYSARRSLPLRCDVRDVVRTPPAAGCFDVIVVARFLERRLTTAIIESLRPEGLLFYQTFIVDGVDSSGPGNPAYRLAANELLEMFAPLRVRVYREEGTVGDCSRGFRNEAMLVAGKPGAD